MEFLKKTGALIVMLAMTCTALPIHTWADQVEVPCGDAPLSPCSDPHGHINGVSINVTVHSLTDPVVVQLHSPFTGGGAVTYFISSDPGNGSITSGIDEDENVTDPDGNVTFTPNGDFSDTKSDQFWYKAKQGAVTSNNGIVYITYSNAPASPAGVDVNATAAYRTPVTIQLGTLFTGADPITYATTSNPTNGTLGTINSDGTVVYTPNGPYSGPDTFTYTSSQDAVTSGSGTASITVSPDAVPPVITAPADQYFATTTIPATPVLVVATASDNSGAAPTITSDAPATFPIGTTTVTWTATDGAGNHSSVTSDVGITQVAPWTISSNKSSALTTESFTATATKFDGVSAYIPAAGAVIGVVLNTSTSVIATSTADINGQATFTVATPGSYLIGIDDNAYATTTPITITAPVDAPESTPAPVVASSGGNGPPVASAPVSAPATSAPAPTSTPSPVLTYSAAAASVLTPTPITNATPAPTTVADSVQPEVLGAETVAPTTMPAPVVADASTTVPVVANTDAQVAAAASTDANNNSTYEALGLVIVLLALAGLIWQWRRRQS